MEVLVSELSLVDYWVEKLLRYVIQTKHKASKIHVDFSKCGLKCGLLYITIDSHLFAV